jgi:P-type Cu2+ transporter
MTPAEFAARSACAHCGLLVPFEREAPPGDTPFCCEGCAAVYAVLTEHGLLRYYALAREAGGRVPAKVTGRFHEELDDPAFVARACMALPEGLLATDLYLEGVHCAACVWLVEKVPALVPGAIEVRLDLPRSRARVVWDPARTKLSELAVALDRIGYPVHPYRGARAAEARRRENRELLLKIGVAAAVAGNVMAIAFGLYGGFLHGMEPEYLRLFRWTSLTVAFPSVFWCGGTFFRGALGAMRARSVSMDVPIALGLAAGYAQGAVNTIRSTGEVYFDVVTTLVFLLLSGRYLLKRRHGTAVEAAELLASLSPSSAHVLADGGEREIPLEALLSGMRVAVLTGESFPADGRVVEGRSNVDLALLTGESRPVPVASGDAVHAGSVNLGGRLEILVESTGEDTRVGRLMRLVEESAKRRAPIVQLADRISGRFVTTVLALAAITLALWWHVSPQLAFDHAIALLIVTCPCALGLATPLAIAAGIGRAARAGFLVRGPDVVEALSRGGRMVLDKTGTLTKGTLSVVAYWGSDEVRALAAAAEAHSSHPVARALATSQPPAMGPVEIEETPGFGIVGRVGRHVLVVGSPAFLASRFNVWPPAVTERVDAWSDDGLTPIVVAVDGAVSAVFGLGDPLRDDARGAMVALRALGYDPSILSGDHPGAVAAVARCLDVPPHRARGGVGPEEKVAYVLDEQARSKVVMVGDGVNDAAALAAADVGIAVHGGAEAALAVADVFVTRPGLDRLVELVVGCRRTMRVVKRNLAFSLVYNAAAVVLAMTGWINPLVAAILMPLSSLTVILSSSLSRSFTPSSRQPWR